MVLTVDFDGESVVEWRVTPDGICRTVVDDYQPTLYVGAPVSERQLCYTLETETDPVPDTDARDLRTLHLQFPAHESEVSALTPALNRQRVAWVDTE